jgi:ABC-type multidrug transport system fused ATPase/permease subunit
MKPEESYALEAPTLLRYLWSQRRRFSRGVSMALLRCLIIAPCPWLFQVIIDEHVKTANRGGIAMTGLVFLGLLCLHYTFAVQGAMMIARELTDLMTAVRSEIFNKLHFLNFGFLDRQKSGRLLSKYAFDTQKVEGAITQILNQILPNTLYSLSLTFILVAMHWQLSIVLLMMVPILIVIRYTFHERIRVSNEESRLAQEKLTGTASEVITALRLVRSLGEEKQVTAHVHERSTDFARTRLELTGIGARFGTFTYVSTQFLSLLTIASGAYFVIQGSMTLGTLLAFMAGLPVIMMPVHLFANIGEQYYMGQESYRSIKELLSSTYVEEWRGTIRPAPLRGEIRFDHVHFAYPGATRKVFEDFDLKIEAGEHVALVGHSGSGKSTLTYLILGLYKAEAGEVRIDGHPLADLDMRWLRRQCAIVLQENLLLSGTVADNIKFARPEATDDEVREAARQANADEFILRMPEGYQTKIGERGVMLSGGQRQRLSIARAILRNPRILILDEATSSLDYESERLVQQALERLAAGRTVITIAHRLSTVRRADRVVVLDQGRIVEQGRFDVLSGVKGGYFSELLTAQALGPQGEIIS